MNTHTRSEMFQAAIRVLRRSGEQVCETIGGCIVNGVIETYDDVIAYADDLYRAEKNMPLHPRAALFGRPKSRVRNYCEKV